MRNMAERDVQLHDLEGKKDVEGWMGKDERYWDTARWAPYQL